MSELSIVAFGGNALWPPGRAGEFEAQVDAARSALAPLVRRVERGARLILVFGNGPQVGAELLRSHLAQSEVTPASLDVCVAATQGTMGYALERALRDALAERGVRASVATVSTLVRVDPEDPAFARPDKPVGPCYTAAEASRLVTERGFKLRLTPHGHRRVVASPRPQEVLNLDVLRDLLNAGHVVIAGGGGGVPVRRAADGRWVGVEAVIDKDWTAALMGRALGAPELIDLTGVDYVQRGFGRADATALPTLSVAEARQLLAAGEFPPGSMGPKIEAALWFLERAERVLITSLERLGDALDGRCGTRLVR